MTLTTKTKADLLVKLLNKFIPIDQQKPIFTLINFDIFNTQISLPEAVYLYLKNSSKEECQKLSNLIIELTYQNTLKNYDYLTESDL